MGLPLKKMSFMSKLKPPKRPADLEARDAQVLALPADLQIQDDFRVPKGSSRGAPRRRDTDGGFVLKGCKKGGRKVSYMPGFGRDSRAP